MRRREFIALLGGAAFPGSLAGYAQQPRLYRVGIILGAIPVSELSTYPPTSALVQGLRALGYVEGKNLVLEWRSAEMRYERVPEIVRELVSNNVDVLVVSTYPVALAARRATQTTPIVRATIADPVRFGLVTSLSRPGGNVTGISGMSEISGKRLALLNELAPRLTRVAVIRNSSIPTHATFWKETEVAARKLGVSLHPMEVRGPEDFESTFASAMQAKPEALLVLDDPLTVRYRHQIVRLAAKHRLVAMYGSREFTDEGGLISYGASQSDLFRRAANFVDKILKGAKPADLPVEQATTFELVINLKTAEALGLTIPSTLLARADEVIE
jgi:putative tryptophan/tyrosine transport system substrate-binding protein